MPHRPASADEDVVEKVMVMLTPHQVQSLDRICLEIRQKTGIKAKRSMLIRALIDGFLASSIDYRGARSFQDLAHRIIHASIARKQPN